MNWIVLDNTGFAIAHTVEEWLAADLARRYNGTYKHRNAK